MVTGPPAATRFIDLPALHWPDAWIARHDHHHHRFGTECIGPGAEVEASRGCPYSCSFCAKLDYRDKYRKRDLAIVLEEIDALQRQGARYIYFIDEIFLPQRPLLEALVGRGLSFGIQTRIDLWKPDMLDLLGEAGCVSIEAGVESLTEEGRASLDKLCRMTTDELLSASSTPAGACHFVQANLIKTAQDEQSLVDQWRERLQSAGVWANDPVPLYPYPSSPDYHKLFGAPDDHAWERAHAHYLAQFDHFSEIQDETSRPAAGTGGGMQSPLKMLMTTDAVGGVWTYTIDLAEELCAAGVNVTIAALGPAPSPAQADQATATGARLQTLDAPLDWLANDEAGVAQASQAPSRALARQTGVDLIQVHSPALIAQAPMPTPVISVIHSCVATWWDAVRGGDMPDDLIWRARLVRNGLKRATINIAPSQASPPPSRDSTMTTRHVSCTMRARRRPVAQSKPAAFILSAGRFWDDGKNLATLDRAASFVRSPGHRRRPARSPTVRASRPRMSMRAASWRQPSLRALARATAHLLLHRALRALWPVRTRSRASGLCARARRHPDVPGIMVRRGAVYIASGRKTPLAAALNALAQDPRMARHARRGCAETSGAIHARATGARHAPHLSGCVTCGACGGGCMKIVYFTHSLRSCWNHGNAHFLRGVLSELAARGHDVVPCEPATNWSLDNLHQGCRRRRSGGFRTRISRLEACHLSDRRRRRKPTSMAPISSSCTNGTSLHWSRRIGDCAATAHVSRCCSTTPITAPSATRRRSAPSISTAMMACWRSASGCRMSIANGAGAGASSPGMKPPTRNVFHPPVHETQRSGLVWIGNWGDGERSDELEQFLLRPAREARIPLDIHGVRYPANALAMLRAYGARYHGWLPNARTPQVFAQHLATVHVPRRFYRTHLPGIPTIRVFEALACGIPLVCAPWEDSEGLFTPGKDYLVAEDGAAMTRQLCVCAMTLTCATRLRNMGSRPFARATPAHIASTNFSALSPA